MKTSESIVKIAPALLKAQKEIGSATKDAVNPFFKSKYADLGSVMEACKDALNKSGIIVLQPVAHLAETTTVETILLHESGEFISDTMLVSVKQSNDPQSQGSAITYAKRYSLQSMLFIPSDDDDGEKGTDHKENATPATTNANLDTCEKCGAPFKLSQKGTKYCSKLCWKNPDNLAIKPEIKQTVVTGSPDDIDPEIEKAMDNF